jgi:hypothetical protein
MSRLDGLNAIRGFLAIMSLAVLAGCGGRAVVDGSDYMGVRFVNYNVTVADATLDQGAPGCVYVQATDEYFVAWQDSRGGDADIYARFFEAYRADPSSAEIVICSAAGEQAVPQVACNTADDELLIVWEDYAAGDVDIFGQLVDAATGALIGGNFAISSVIGFDEREPRVTYNSVRSDYLVTWDEDNGTDLDIMGIVVEANGTIPGSAFVITPTTEDQQSASVAYDRFNDCYLVVYMDFFISPLESDLYAQFVDYDGGLIGSDFAVTDDSGNQDFPSVAFNGEKGRFLVVWEDDYFGDPDIESRQVRDDGLLIGGITGISRHPDNQKNPAVTYNRYYGEYIVVWEDNRRGQLGVRAQALSSTACLIGSSVVVNDDDVRSVQPAVCSNAAEGEFFTAWSSRYSGEYDVLGQILDIWY